MIQINPAYQRDPKDPQFQPGDLITHRRYHYRGVIVHRDRNFSGDEHWYLTNQTQPKKDQPWYFVLVDGNQQVTYVAEQNLSLEKKGETIVHPMINLFFSEYDEVSKKYIRNHVPWNPGNPPDSPPPGPPPSHPPPKLSF